MSVEAWHRVIDFERPSPSHGLTEGHPRHNWFICAAHTPADIEQAVAVAEECFAIVAKEIASGDLP